VSLYAHRICESMPLKLRPAVTPAWVGRRSNFWGREPLRDCSLVYMTTSWWCALPYDYFLLLSEGRLWDCTTSYPPTSIKIDYFKQLNMSTVWNGTTGAFGTGSVSGYNLKFSHVFVVFFLFLYRLCVNTNNPYDIIILLILNNIVIYFMTFEIKIYHKILIQIICISSVCKWELQI
jgi:hypothetical protein